MPPMDADQLRGYLEFYQDLGIKTLYRRAGGTACPTADQPKAVMGETLPQILSDIGDCRRCRLHEGRHKLVFGVGNPTAPLVFVGEGPGADEDAQGIPFVGRAGQLLTQMIENTAKREGIALTRDGVYICNVVKCRPPENRTPEPDEMEICGQFLARQLLAIRPKAICALGGTACPTTGATIQRFDPEVLVELEVAAEEISVHWRRAGPGAVSELRRKCGRRSRAWQRGAGG